ncbi:hypothetical protein DW741_09935 [Ruminococcaceae bacterium AM28-23LB]|nr:hypothetical protein DW741_09935 [Ruminococcaceae bacterium AM28-23LB]
MRFSGSNPVSCSETPIKIYGSKEEIRARKSPETVDAPGFGQMNYFRKQQKAQIFRSGPLCLALMEKMHFCRDL